MPEMYFTPFGVRREDRAQRRKANLAAVRVAGQQQVDVAAPGPRRADRECVPARFASGPAGAAGGQVVQVGRPASIHGRSLPASTDRRPADLDSYASGRRRRSSRTGFSVRRSRLEIDANSRGCPGR